jgi:hypothetical protein
MGLPIYITTEIYKCEYDSIPKLTYVEWRRKVTYIFKSNKFRSQIAGKMTKPVELGPNAIARKCKRYWTKRFYNVGFYNATFTIYYLCVPHIQ